MRALGLIGVLGLVALAGCARTPKLLPLASHAEQVTVVAATVADGGVTLELSVPKGSGVATQVEYELWSFGRCVQSGVEPVHQNLSSEAAVPLTLVVPAPLQPPSTVRGDVVLRSKGFENRAPFSGAVSPSR